MPPNNTQNSSAREQNRQSIITNSAPKPTDTEEGAEFFDTPFYEAEHYNPREIRRQARARMAKKRQNMTYSEEGQSDQDAQAPQGKKKMEGIAFVFMLLVAITKDIIDIIAGITLILSLFATPLSVALGLILVTYFLSMGVTPDSKKIATWATAFIIENIPLLGMLPLATISLLITRYLHNKSLNQN